MSKSEKKRVGALCKETIGELTGRIEELQKELFDTKQLLSLVSSTHQQVAKELRAELKKYEDERDKGDYMKKEILEAVELCGAVTSDAGFAFIPEELEDFWNEAQRRALENIPTFTRLGAGIRSDTHEGETHWHIRGEQDGGPEGLIRVVVKVTP